MDAPKYRAFLMYPFIESMGTKKSFMNDQNIGTI